MTKFKAAGAAVLAYLQANPGVVSLAVGQLVLVLAHFGLHVDAVQLYAIGAVVLPVLLAYFKVAEVANRKAAVAEERARHELPAPAVVAEAAEEAPAE